MKGPETLSPSMHVQPYSPDSLEVYLEERRRGAGGIYVPLLLLLALGLIALPFVEVPLTLERRGLLLPALDALPVVAPAAGAVVQAYAREGHLVAAGDTLVLLDSIGLLRLARLPGEGGGFALLAPHAGRLASAAALRPGDWVEKGEVIALLASDAPLVAEITLAAGEVPHLQLDQPVRLWVEGGGAGESGWVRGQIVRIEADSSTSSGSTRARVRIRPQAAAAAAAAWRSGMPIGASFPLRRQRLWSPPPRRQVGASHRQTAPAAVAG